MKKLSRSLMLALMTVCLAVCCLFAGCSPYAGTYKFESVTASILGFEKTTHVDDSEDDEYTKDYMVLKVEGNNKFTLTEKTNGQTVIKEGTWEEVEEGTIKLIYTSDNSEQTVKIDDKTAIFDYTIGGTGAKVTLKK